MRKVTWSALVVSAAFPLALLAPSVTASAATRPATPEVTCSGHGCDGKDPESTGCASTAITAEYANIFDAYAERIGQLQLRYSTACRTVWARVIAFGSTSGSALAERNSDGLGYTCTGLTYSQTLGAYSCYTLMLYDGGVTSFASGAISEYGDTYTARTASY
jgi:Protein of unknown function (DUF2690)